MASHKAHREPLKSASALQLRLMTRGTPSRAQSTLRHPHCMPESKAFPAAQT